VTTFRAAALTDAPGIARVHVRASQAGYRGMLSDEELDALSIASRTRNWLDWLLDSRCLAFVAADGGAVVGFCSALGPSPDADVPAGTAEVSALYVEPARWRQGIGGRLLRRTLGALRRAAWQEATLWVIDGNVGAQALYEHFGFAPDGASKPYADAGAAQRGPLTIRLHADLRSPTEGRASSAGRYNP